MHPSNKVTAENANEVIRYHRPVGDQPARHEALAAGAEAFIRCLLHNAPDCADRSSAIRHIRLAKMEASAAVALEERPLEIWKIGDIVKPRGHPLGENPWVVRGIEGEDVMIEWLEGDVKKQGAVKWSDVEKVDP